MIPYFNRRPYSLHPVQRGHVALIGALLLFFAAGCYFLGGLVTVRLLLLAMILCAVWVWALFARHLMQAVRRKALFTIYGPVALADRPILFVGGCTVLIVVPLVLFAFLLHEAQSPQIQLFRWLWRW
jgi:hypothetical protein